MKLTRGDESSEKEAILKNVVVVDAGSDVKVPVKVFLLLLLCAQIDKRKPPSTSS